MGRQRGTRAPHDELAEFGFPVWAALHKATKYHPRKWVDSFKSYPQQASPLDSPNPTNGSWWIVQVRPIFKVSVFSCS